MKRKTLCIKSYKTMPNEMTKQRERQFKPTNPMHQSKCHTCKGIWTTAKSSNDV